MKNIGGFFMQLEDFKNLLIMIHNSMTVLVDGDVFLTGSITSKIQSVLTEEQKKNEKVVVDIIECLKKTDLVLDSLLKNKHVVAYWNLQGLKDKVLNISDKLIEKGKKSPSACRGD